MATFHDPCGSSHAPPRSSARSSSWFWSCPSMTRAGPTSSARPTTWWSFRRCSQSTRSSMPSTLRVPPDSRRARGTPISSPGSPSRTSEARCRWPKSGACSRVCSRPLRRSATCWESSSRRSGSASLQRWMLRSPVAACAALRAEELDLRMRPGQHGQTSGVSPAGPSVPKPSQLPGREVAPAEGERKRREPGVNGTSRQSVAPKVRRQFTASEKL